MLHSGLILYLRRLLGMSLRYFHLTETLCPVMLQLPLIHVMLHHADNPLDMCFIDGRIIFGPPRWTFMEDFFHLNRQMNNMSLAIVNVVVNEPQTLRRIEKCKMGNIQRQQLF